MRSRELSDLAWGFLLITLAVALLTLPPPDPTQAWQFAVLAAPLPGCILIGRYFVGRPTPEGTRWPDRHRWH
jgi:hypothetical protein